MYSIARFSTTTFLGNRTHGYPLLGYLFTAFSAANAAGRTRIHRDKVTVASTRGQSNTINATAADTARVRNGCECTLPQRRKNNGQLLLAVSLGMATLLSLAELCHTQETPSSSRTSPLRSEGAQRGEVQFQQTCAMCHGSAARGTGSGPSLIDSSLVRHDEGGNLIAPVVRGGRADHGMPAFPSLTGEQISDLVAFLHAKVIASDKVSAVGAAADYALKRLLTGNAEDGKHYFAQHCTACHNATGDLAGIARKYAPAELEERMLYPRQDVRTGTVSLPSGEKIKGRITYSDDFNVAILDDQGRYHSWPLKNGVTLTPIDPLHGHLELLDRYSDKDIHDLFAYLETLP